jgi:hypothetical protein
MCMSCGCKRPDERHGDERNIVRQDLQDAATAAEITTAQVVRNIQESFEAGRGTADDRQTAGAGSQGGAGAGVTGAPD